MSTKRTEESGHHFHGVSSSSESHRRLSGRQINVPVKFWIGHMSDEESNLLYKCSIRRDEVLVG
jgi:hypothetical protein